MVSRLPFVEFLNYLKIETLKRVSKSLTKQYPKYEQVIAVEYVNFLVLFCLSFNQMTYFISTLHCPQSDIVMRIRTYLPVEVWKKSVYKQISRCGRFLVVRN